MGNVEQVGILVGILGCGVATLPVQYLGLPLGDSCKARHIWYGVIEKLGNCLANCKKDILVVGL